MNVSVAGMSSPAVKWSYFSRGSRAIWIVRSASTAFMLVLIKCRHPGRPARQGPMERSRSLWYRPVCEPSRPGGPGLDHCFWCIRQRGGNGWSCVEWQERLRPRLGNGSLMLVTSLYFLLALVICPLLVIGSVAAISRSWGRIGGTWLSAATQFSYALLPLGFSMWLSHYSFHFLGSYETLVPAMQQFVKNLGWHILGKPAWGLACCRPVAAWLPRLEIVSLDLGLLLSLYTGYRIALHHCSPRSRAIQAFLPWGLLIVGLFAIAVWIVLQPMQMRGTMPGG